MSAAIDAAVVSGPGQIRIEQREVPELLPGTALVDVQWVGLCGSDLHYYQHGRNGIFTIREPLILGHEYSGIVRELAEDADTEARVGDRVAVHPLFPAPRPGAQEGHGMNRYRGGSFAGSASTDPHTQGALIRTVRVDANQLRPLPDGLPLRRAALHEPFAVALHGVDRVRERIAGAQVLVSGAGPVGCLAVAALRARGAGTIVAADMQPRALEVASAVGADEVLLVTEQQPEPESFDITVEAAGVVPSLVTCLGATRAGGAIVQLGILPPGDLSVPLSGLVSNEQTLYGSQRFDIEIDEAIRLLAEHPELDRVITHEFALADIEQAFATAADSAASTKVLVRVGSADEETADEG